MKNKINIHQSNTCVVCFGPPAWPTAWQLIFVPLAAFIVAEMIGPLIGVQETPFLLPSTVEVGLFWVMPATAVTSFFELKSVATR